MRTIFIVILSAAMACAAATAEAKKYEMSEPEASIPFANHGGVNDWHPLDDQTLLIKGIGKQWYKATLFSPCLKLRTSETIGFLIEPDGSLSKWSGIVVGHQVCRFKSLTKSAPPPAEKK